MSRVRVKVCGLTRAEDVAAAVALGADALGFVLWPGSPRYVTLQAVCALADGVPAFVTRVGVFVDASPGEVARVVREASLDAVQLHGAEFAGDYGDVGARVIKAVSLDGSAAVDRAVGLPPGVTVLVDATAPVERGGTGRRADWTRAAMLARRRPIVLAGGLSAGTVAAAIREVRPVAVDVSSGVEEAPGRKDHERLRAFFAAVTAAAGDAP